MHCVPRRSESQDAFPRRVQTRFVWLCIASYQITSSYFTLINISFIYFLLSLSELTITETELNAMAADDTMGFNLPAMATGIAITLLKFPNY